MLPTQVQYWSYKEQQRHNIITENESIRHNKQTEKLGFDTLAEQKRHNVKTEQQTDWFNSETKRHNLAAENIGRLQAAASQTSAHASLISARASMQNANTNSFLSQYQAGNLKASTTKVQSDTARGWFDSIIGAINPLKSSFR